MDQRPVYRLTLRALPDKVPDHHRLKALLKYALRACGFRCLDIAEVKPPFDPATICEVPSDQRPPKP